MLKKMPTSKSTTSQNKREMKANLKEAKNLSSSLSEHADQQVKQQVDDHESNGYLGVKKQKTTTQQQLSESTIQQQQQQQQPPSASPTPSLGSIIQPYADSVLQVYLERQLDSQGGDYHTITSRYVPIIGNQIKLPIVSDFFEKFKAANGEHSIETDTKLLTLLTELDVLLLFFENYFKMKEQEKEKEVFGLKLACYKYTHQQIIALGTRYRNKNQATKSKDKNKYIDTIISSTKNNTLLKAAILSTYSQFEQFVNNNQELIKQVSNLNSKAYKFESLVLYLRPAFQTVKNSYCPSKQDDDISQLVQAYFQDKLEKQRIAQEEQQHLEKLRTEQEAEQTRQQQHNASGEEKYAAMKNKYDNLDKPARSVFSTLVEHDTALLTEISHIKNRYPNDNTTTQGSFLKQLQSVKIMSPSVQIKDFKRLTDLPNDKWDTHTLEDWRVFLEQRQKKFEQKQNKKEK